jgi:hypothetical protein
MWSIQETRAPLYGRFNLTLPVFPFRPHEAAEMLPQLSPEDRALVYGLVGGMPLYLGWWRQDVSIGENLLRLVGGPGSPLLTEGRLVMETEVGSEQASTVLFAVASGATRYGEIQNVVGADPARAIDRLLEARLIERVSPAGEDPANPGGRSTGSRTTFSPSTWGRCAGTGRRSSAGTDASSCPHWNASWTTSWARHSRKRSGIVCGVRSATVRWNWPTSLRSGRGGTPTASRPLQLQQLVYPLGVLGTDEPHDARRLVCRQVLEYI